MTALEPNDASPHIPHSLPQCPSWCGGDHGVEAGGAEADGLHHTAFGPADWLHDIRNSVGGHLMRRGGFEYATFLEQHDQWDGRRGLTLVTLEARLLRQDETEPGGISCRGVEMEMTPGEARSLAAALVSLAERAEGLR